MILIKSIKAGLFTIVAAERFQSTISVKDIIALENTCPFINQGETNATTGGHDEAKNGKRAKKNLLSSKLRNNCKISVLQ